MAILSPEKPSSPCDGFINGYHFESPEELAFVRDYYQGFTGMLGSWVFVKDNLVFQVRNDLPKAMAEQYEVVLNSLE